jgi:hypothetical protein
MMIRRVIATHYLAVPAPFASGMDAMAELQVIMSGFDVRGSASMLT